MASALLGRGQAGVGEAQQRSVRLLDQVDLDKARPRRHHLAAVPAEAVGSAVHRHHLAEGAASAAGPGDVDEIESPGLRLELRLDRKSGVAGKSRYVSVDFGGRCILKKKNNIQ